MRVYRDGAQQRLAAKTVTGATNANPCVITSTSHGYSNGDEVYIEEVGGMTELNTRNFKVANVAANTFELQYMDSTDVDSTSFGAYTSGGTAEEVYTITTAYVEADLSALQFAQSADIITITHPNYPPKELARTGDTAWTLTDITFTPALTAIADLVSSSVGTTYYYVVTSVNTETGEESLISNEAGSTATTSTLTWTSVSGAGYYNIYRKLNDVYGWIGVAGSDASPSFKDTTYDETMDDNPPEDRQPFASDYPSCVSYYQQRRIFANTDNDPEKIWTTKTGLRNNLMVSTPLQDDDAVTFSLLGRQVNEVRHILDIGKMIVFTESGEWAIEGDAGGVLSPTGINPRQHTANGSGDLPPIVVSGSALYVQARGSVVRDLGFDYQTAGYRGNELTIFANHLFDNYTLVDWAYQQIPHSIVWVVRSDGALLGLTYIREHQVFGWHKHDFDGGTVENVAVVPEGTEDVVYVTIKRTINSKVVRYIEKLNTRQLNDIEDAVFVDSALSYDGTHAGATTMTLSGGSTWAYDETLTLTASASFFASTDAGNAIHLTGADGTLIRFTINAYTSGTVVTGKPHKTVPSGMQAVAITSWGKAVDQVGGLWHLEGEQVSVFGDGFVVANPNNTSYDTITVTDGIATLDKPYQVIHVGKPITADIETLNIDFPGPTSIVDKKKAISKVTCLVESTRGLFAGRDADNLEEFQLRENEDYDSPPDLITDTIEVNIEPDWGSGRVFIRQSDPVPVSILSILPTGYIGG
jgi:hypothetical protein